MSTVVYRRPLPEYEATRLLLEAADTQTRCSADDLSLWIDAGAKIDTRRFMNRTPLHNACRHGHGDMAKTLIQLGGNIHALDQFSRTPLSYAAEAGQLAVLEEMVAQAAAINHRDASGKNALSYAELQCSRPAINLLLDHGIEIICHGGMDNYIRAYYNKAITRLNMLNAQPDLSQYQPQDVIYALNTGRVGQIIADSGSPESMTKLSQIIPLLPACVIAELGRQCPSIILRLEAHAEKPSPIIAGWSIDMTSVVRPDDILMTNI